MGANDNASFASCGGDRTVFLWDVTTGAGGRRFEGHGSRVNAICFGGDESSGGKSGVGSGGGIVGDAILFSGSYDRTVRCWDMRSRSRDPIQVVEGFKDSVMSVRCGLDEIVTGCV